MSAVSRLVSLLIHRIGLILTSIMLLAMLLPNAAFAHSTLVKAVPPQDSKLQKAPAQVELTFNERIADTLFSVRLLDQTGKDATSNKAQLNKEHNGLMLSLPELSKGTYTVTYRVISADGHPVSDSYVFTYGNIVQGTTQGSSHPAASVDFSAASIFKYISRIVYYMALLSLAGWLGWGVFLMNYASGSKLDVAQNKKLLHTGGIAFQRMFLISLLLLIFSQWNDFFERDVIREAFQSGQGVQLLSGFFLHTGVGLFWLVSLLLSFAGFFILQRSKWVDGGWAAAILAMKSTSGHAVAVKPAMLTLALDFVHLAAAALWVGGLVLIAVLWRRNKEEAEKVLPVFSKAAFIAICVLIVTGSISTLLFLPNITYLAYTAWGTLLIMKIIAVVLVIAAAAGIRILWKRRGMGSIGKLFTLDLSLMVLIVCIVGILTYQKALPDNLPLHWHVMGEKMHMTTEISPNVPGNNQFHVTVWLPEQAGDPKKVTLLLHDISDRDIAPIQVPLKKSEDTSTDAFTGFRAYDYDAEGPYLPFAGKWEVEVKVISPADDEIVYDKEIRIY